MDDNNKDSLEEAQNIRNLIRSQELYSEERSNEASLEFTRLEVQIAVIVLGIIGVYLDNFKEMLGTNTFLKLIFALTIFSLISSLLLGLLHLKVIESFWDGISLKRELRFEAWSKVITKEMSFKEAKSFAEGTKLGSTHMIQIPKWTWILQSVLLVISVVSISILSVFFIFKV